MLLLLPNRLLAWLSLWCSLLTPGVEKVSCQRTAYKRIDLQQHHFLFGFLAFSSELLRQLILFIVPIYSAGLQKSSKSETFPIPSLAHCTRREEAVRAGMHMN
jgi:hypothetical protein